MATNTADLNNPDGSASGPFYVRLTVDVLAQNYSGNYTTYRWRLFIGCWSNGWGTWSGYTQYWSVNIGGAARSGQFTFDFRPGSSSAREIELANGNVDIGHDANGWRPAFVNYGSIDTNHTSVGDGTVATWVDAPRIPRTPLAPGAPVASNVGPTSMTLTWTGTPDSRGAAVDQYLLRRSPNADMTEFTDYSLSGATLTHTPTGLTPGQTYYWAVYAHNSQGYSPRSPVTQTKTIAGGKVRNSAVYKTSTAWVRDGGVYKRAIPFVKQAGVWKPSS